MSFDRPGLPHPGKKANEVEIDEALAGDGIELADGELDGVDHPGGVSEGPVPNPPRRPSDEAADGVPASGPAESEQPVDDPAHEDPAG